MHHHLIGVDGLGARDLADAERVERREAVGSELDAGADLAEFGACSSTLTANPCRTSARAAAIPPIPPPATSTRDSALEVAVISVSVVSLELTELSAVSLYCVQTQHRILCISFRYIYPHGQT
jgi:hypothetical protein